MKEQATRKWTFWCTSCEAQSDVAHARCPACEAVRAYQPLDPETGKPGEVPIRVSGVEAPRLFGVFDVVVPDLHPEDEAALDARIADAVSKFPDVRSLRNAAIELWRCHQSGTLPGAPSAVVLPLNRANTSVSAEDPEALACERAALHERAKAAFLHMVTTASTERAARHACRTPAEQKRALQMAADNGARFLAAIDDLVQGGYVELGIHLDSPQVRGVLEILAKIESAKAQFRTGSGGRPTEIHRYDLGLNLHDWADALGMPWPAGSGTPDVRKAAFDIALRCVEPERVERPWEHFEGARANDVVTGIDRSERWLYPPWGRRSARK